MEGCRKHSAPNLEAAMEYLPNGYELEIPKGCFPLTTDSMLLAHFAAKAGNVLDLGSGCGTLGLLLCAQKESRRVTGLELDKSAHAAALENIRRNQLGARMESICGDVRQVPGLFAPGSFPCCISNPPYFSDGPASSALLARREDACSLEDLFRAAGWALKYGGDFYLVHRPERLGELILCGGRNGMEAKRLGIVRHKDGGPPALVLVQLRKGGKPGLCWEDWVLHDRNGNPAPLYKEIYHIREE